MDKAELIRKFCEKFGHEESEFSPKTVTDAERIDELEACVLELAEIIGGEVE